MKIDESYPNSCPLVSVCRKSPRYKNTVNHIKNNHGYFLNCPNELKRITCNCPHQIEDAYWDDFVRADKWLLYLKCEIFSKWFWEEAAKSATPVGE